VVDSSYFPFTERESLGVARECESDDMVKTMIYRESQKWQTRVENVTRKVTTRGTESWINFTAKGRKLFPTKIVEKSESHILGELRMLRKSEGFQRTEREGTKWITGQNITRHQSS